MKISIKSTIDFFSKVPSKLFLIDGLGAAMTTVSLFLVLRPYYTCFGMPANVLTYLAAIAWVYCAYSMSCYFVQPDYWKPYLRIIAISNFLYCIGIMALLYTYYNALTPIGVAYFSAEMLIIIFLACLELKVANGFGSKKTGKS